VLYKTGLCSFELESDKVGISVGFYYVLRNICGGSDKIGTSVGSWYILRNCCGFLSG
jgi:hypothetical protein